MKIAMKELSYEPRWFSFPDRAAAVTQEGPALEIRPYPFSQSNVLLRDGGFVITGEEQFKIFKHCLNSWRGFVGDDDQPLKLTEDVKKVLFDFRVQGIADFVLARNREFQDQKATEEKN